MKRITLLIMVLFMFIACKPGNESKEKEEETKSIKEGKITHQKDEWISLFDGSSLENWRGYLTDTIPQEWSIENGTLAFVPGEKGSKNIISKAQFTNFVLALEWKIAEAGNSGIFWGVHEDSKFSEVYQTGPEIQVLDNERHTDAKVRGKLHQAGALYDMIEPSQDVAKPAGEWNHCTISINHTTNIGIVTLNTVEIVSFPLHGEKWNAMIANSKFRDWKGFGKYKTGHIALQDHGDKVWFRNIKIKEIHE